jgi:hypothetical protein
MYLIKHKIYRGQKTPEALKGHEANVYAGLWIFRRIVVKPKDP